MKIFVLIIEHEHGLNVSAHTTDEGAREELYQYCLEWWDDMFGKEDNTCDEMNREEVIEAYFEESQASSGVIESHTINECELQGLPELLDTWLEVLPEEEKIISIIKAKK